MRLKRVHTIRGGSFRRRRCRSRLSSFRCRLLLLLLLEVMVVLLLLLLHLQLMLLLLLASHQSRTTAHAQNMLHEHIIFLRGLRTGEVLLLLRCSSVRRVRERRLHERGRKLVTQEEARTGPLVDPPLPHVLLLLLLLVGVHCVHLRGGSACRIERGIRRDGHP